MSDTAGLLLALVLLAGNAFFVGAEFALISARRTQIEPRVLAGSARARSTLRAMENVWLMAGAQLGITICSLGLGAVGEPAVAHLIEGPLEAVGMPEGLLHPTAFALALSIVVFLHMVVSEMVPKNIALAVPERSALALGPVLALVVAVLRPLIWLLKQGANLVLRLIGVQPKDEVTSAFTRDEVAGLVRKSAARACSTTASTTCSPGPCSLTTALPPRWRSRLERWSPSRRTRPSGSWSGCVPAPASPASPSNRPTAADSATSRSRTCSTPRPSCATSPPRPGGSGSRRPTRRRTRCARS